MKIGILSMQKILNYGSFLQAYSLKKQFENRGHNVYFIDIEKGKQIVEINTEPLNIAKKIDKYFFKRIENFLLFKKMSKIHIADYTEFLETDKKLAGTEEFDLVVIGSDEVFNCATPSPWGFSKQLFGDIKNAKNVVTYAASCGSTNKKDAEKLNVTSEIKTAMENLKVISVRDENTADFVRNITGKEPLRHLDPVYITNYDEKIPMIKTKKKYLLIYAYSNRITDPAEILAIKKYAKEKNLDIICVGMQQRWCKRNIPANAFTLLSYVKNAEAIITDTFHGTVFSIKYNKKFITIIRQSNSNKLGGLLNQFGLTNRAVENPDDLKNIMEEPIDYKAVNEYIENEQIRTKEYLDKVCLGDFNA